MCIRSAGAGIQGPVAYALSPQIVPGDRLLYLVQNAIDGEMVGQVKRYVSSAASAITS